MRAVRATAVRATAVQATAVQATAVQATAVQATAVQATAVHLGGGGELTILKGTLFARNMDIQSRSMGITPRRLSISTNVARTAARLQTICTSNFLSVSVHGGPAVCVCGLACARMRVRACACASSVFLGRRKHRVH